MKQTYRTGWRYRRSLLAACVTLCVIAFLATHMPLDNLPSGMPSDKVMPFVASGILSAVLLLTLTAYRHNRNKRDLIVLFSMMLYAGFDELTQRFVNRHTSFYDWVADMGGAVAAILLMEIALAIIRRCSDRTSA